jgi:hypothetical protein
VEIKLFVDDIRSLDDEAVAKFYDDSWTVVRTISEAIRLLHTQQVDEISLDHDIMHSTNPRANRHESLLSQSFCECPEDYSCIANVIALMPKELRPRKVIVHSANGVGRYKMLQILKDSGCELLERGVDHPHGKYVGPMKDLRKEN